MLGEHTICEVVQRLVAKVRLFMSIIDGEAAVLCRLATPQQPLFGGLRCAGRNVFGRKFAALRT